MTKNRAESGPKLNATSSFYFSQEQDTGKEWNGIHMCNQRRDDEVLTAQINYFNLEQG
jgi:hypothetical protein